MLKVKIDFKSFFQRGVKNIDNEFMIALITGYQGSGKTFYSIKKMEDMKGIRTIYTNVGTYRSRKHEVHYFTNISELYDNHEKDAIFLIDELSKKYTKDSHIDKAFYSWLQQSRKHNRQVYLITQEYLQVPQWLRGVANYVYTTRKIPILPVCCTTLGIPVLDNDTKEWGVQELALYFYKRTKKIANLYDTYELINEL